MQGRKITEKRKGALAMKLSSDLFSKAAFIIAFCALLIGALSGCTEKQTAPVQVGTVKQIKSGTLEREDVNHAWKALSQNGRIYAGDRVRTGPDGTAVLTLNNVGSALIKPNTEFTVGNDPMDFKTVLHHGYVWIKTALSPGAKLNIQAAGAVAGVRGTSVSVLSDEQGIDVCTCKGEVTVTLMSGKAMGVNSGMYAAVGADGVARAPEHGKPMLEKLWKEKTARFTPCLDCHRKGKKPQADI